MRVAHSFLSFALNYFIMSFGTSNFSFGYEIYYSLYLPATSSMHDSQKISEKIVPFILQIEDRLVGVAKFFPESTDDEIYLSVRGYGRQGWQRLLKPIVPDASVATGTATCRPNVIFFQGITFKQLQEIREFKAQLHYKIPTGQQIYGHNLYENLEKTADFTLIPYAEKRETNRQNYAAIGIRMNPEDIAALFGKAGPVTETLLTEYYFSLYDF